MHMFFSRHVTERCVATLKTRNASYVTTLKTATLETWEGASLVPGSAFRVKGEKSASEASREVVTARLASPADIFPIRPGFLPFSPTAEPGPRQGWGEEE